MVKSISSFTFHFFKKAGLLRLTPRNDVIFPLPLRERARVRGNSSLRATTRNRIVVVFYNSTLPNDRFIYFYISFRKLLAFSIPYCSSANLKHSSQSTCSATVGTSAKDFTTSKSSLSLVFLSKLAFLSP